MSENSLSDILNDEPPAEEAPAPEAVAETAEPEPVSDGQPRDEHGRFAPKGDKQVEETASAPPAPQNDPPEGHAPIAALRDERRKRQELEAELERLRAQAQQPAAPPVQQQQAPDRWEDPEGYDQWLVARAAEVAKEQAIHAYQADRLTRSGNAARTKYEDYDSVIPVFGEMIRSNPSLYERMLTADNPAEFAYANAKTELELRQYGGVDALVEARIAAREAERLKAVESQLPPSPPPSISSDRSVGARSGPAWSGPTPLGDLLS